MARVILVCSRSSPECVALQRFSGRENTFTIYRARHKPIHPTTRYTLSRYSALARSPVSFSLLSYSCPSRYSSPKILARLVSFLTRDL